MCTTLFNRNKRTKASAYLDSGIKHSAEDFENLPMTTAYYPSRPHLRRNSPLSVFGHSHGFAADAPMIQRIDVGDSSDDDEIPQPMKFSALTKALLESEAPEQVSPIRKEKEYGLGGGDDIKRSDSAVYRREEKLVVDTPSRAPILKIVRKPSPHGSGDRLAGDQSVSGTRVVQVGTVNDSAKRTVSISRSRAGTPAQEYKTPAPAPRAVRIGRHRAGSNSSLGHASEASASRPGSSNDARSVGPDDHHDVDGAFNRSASAAPASDAGSRYAPSTLARSRNTSAESAAPPGSMRVKRAPVGTGSFLRGAPVRRGFRRRDSDDHPSPNEEHPSFSQSVQRQENEDEPQGRSDDPNTSLVTKEPVSRHDFANPEDHARSSQPPASLDRSRHPYRLGSRPASRQSSNERQSRRASVERQQNRADALAIKPLPPASLAISSRKASNDSLQSRATLEQAQRELRPSVSHGSYRPPPPKIYNDASEDQENMPPPTFRRNKDHDFKYLGKSEKVSVLETQKQRTVADTPVPVPAGHTPRKALGALSENTPLRPAPPPPPKMTVLDAATKTAGASTTKSKKRRQHILVNGKLFTQMNKLGKGGSGDVYCVMAENYKLFALKKVKLEDCDETAVRGYKGEIDLLRKLVDVDRVVRLYDWELDESKQTLSVLMEKGDNDFNRVLTQAINGIDSKFDPVLTRFYWKEMLECVQAVHDYDIVHSDLKPANFLMVQGKLKLIDFGIANAIDIDNTVNVHRDSHIGTPNYMSPESITDTNAPVPGAERNTTDPKTGRVMKLGKPSDVWSLGCILYQMVYGRPPFAHIANQISRIMAITNHRVVIEFPTNGIGGVHVPATLRGTLRRCLQRDASLRPTVAQLLSLNDAWLYPEAGQSVQMSEELLGQIIGKVVERCRDPKRGVPSQDEVRQYPASFMAKIREMIEREGVQG